MKRLVFALLFLLLISPFAYSSGGHTSIPIKGTLAVQVPTPQITTSGDEELPPDYFTGSDFVVSPYDTFFTILAVVFLLIVTLLLFIFEDNKLNGALVLGSGVLLLLGITLIINVFYQIDPQRSLTIASGYLALFVLCFTLIIGPLMRIFKTRFFATLLSYRRNTGVLTFILILVHVIMVSQCL
ncbi:hypothetical protein HZC07_01340 [Candidatus Micrarchaeota archaeon]|nr:hypothetical protein [Candidatus Micrarchaeota archaeon]